jgi:ABC-2 type transport system ATP-binding protein
MHPIIEVTNLSHQFAAKRVLDCLSYTVAEGEVFGVLGPNGAGKTTSVRILNGVLAPSSGTVRVLGLDPLADGARVRAQTGVLTETPSLYERLSGRDNLLTFGALDGVLRGRSTAAWMPSSTSLACSPAPATWSAAIRRG